MFKKKKKKELQKADIRVNGIRIPTTPLSEKECILIANLWSVYIGIKITPTDVEMMLAMVEKEKSKGMQNDAEKCISYASCVPATMEEKLENLKMEKYITKGNDK